MTAECELACDVRCPTFLDTADVATLRWGTGYLPVNRGVGGTNGVRRVRYPEPARYACTWCAKARAAAVGTGRVPRPGRQPCAEGAHPDCGHRLLDTHDLDSLRRGSGWLDVNRGVGGPHACHVTEYATEWACAMCLDWLKAGGIPGQGTLL